MREIANDRIARRAKEQHKRRLAEAKRNSKREPLIPEALAWLGDGPVKGGMRVRLSRADLAALGYAY